MPAAAPERKALFTAAEKGHGWSRTAVTSYGSSLRKSWVREHVPAQEAQSLAARAYDAVAAWHWQILRQCRRRGRAIDLAVRAVAYLYNLNLELRINS